MNDTTLTPEQSTEPLPADDQERLDLLARLPVYYRARLNPNNLGTLFIRWNWCAFFFGFLWAAYHRMYREHFRLSLAFISVALIAESFIPPAYARYIPLFCLLMLFVFMGIYGTALYGKNIQRVYLEQQKQLQQKRQFAPATFWLGTLRAFIMSDLIFIGAALIATPVQLSLQYLTPYRLLEIHHSGDNKETVEEKFAGPDGRELAEALETLPNHPDDYIVLHGMGKRPYMIAGGGYIQGEARYYLEYDDKNGLYESDTLLTLSEAKECFLKFRQKDLSYQTSYRWKKRDDAPQSK